MSDDDERVLVPNDVLASGQLRCSGCGGATEAARSVEEDTRPREDDRSMCWECGVVSIFARTSLGYWQLRAPDPRERREIDADDAVRKARAALTAAKGAGRGPRSVGHDAGGRPAPEEQLVVVACEPVSWDAAAVRHDLTTGQVSELRRWVTRNIGDSVDDPGVVEIACATCDLATRVSPPAQMAVFNVQARVLCVVCVMVLKDRLGGGS